MLIDWLLISLGIYFLVAVLVKPSIFWERRSMKMRRELLGDRNTILLYVVMGVSVLAFGIAGLMGYL